jgi:hypothetical protein
MTGSSRFKNLASLENEIRKLQSKAKQLEQKMGQELENLQENYGSMALNSIFPVRKEKEGPATGLLRVFTGNERLRKTLGRLADYLAEKTSDRLDQLLEKIFGKKDH